MYTLNGTGTRLYGQRDEAPDGSYTATKWVVLLFLPLLPLGSYRVLAESSSGMEVYRNSTYSLVALPLNWRQVMRTYAVSLFAGPLLLLFLAVALASVVSG